MSVVSLPGIITKAHRLEPDPALIEKCEELLALARSGELRGAAFGYVLLKGDILSTVSGWRAEKCERFAITAAVAELHHHVMRSAVDSD